MSKGLDSKHRPAQTLPISLKIPPQSLFRTRAQFPLPKKPISMPPSPIDLSPESHFPSSQYLSPKVAIYTKKAYSGTHWRGGVPRLPGKPPRFPAYSPIYRTQANSPARFLPDLPRLYGRSPSHVGFPPSELDNTVVKWGFRTRTGEIGGKPKRQNQDSCFLAPMLVPGSYLFAVCDGHGTYGHEVSAFIKEKLPREVMKALVSIEETTEKMAKAVEIGVRKVVEGVDRSRIDVSFSGSTCVAVAIHGKAVICGNVGDSRAILVGKRDEEWGFIELSKDHKPDSPGERIRIVSQGGRVSPFRNETGMGIGPARVWINGEEIPGLAMSRSIGDAIAHSVGVTPIPDITTHLLTPEDKAIVIASDGLWEFVPNEKVTRIVSMCWESNDLEACCELLIEEALARWRLEDDCIDDITVVVVFVQVPSLLV